MTRRNDKNGLQGSPALNWIMDGRNRRTMKVKALIGTPRSDAWTWQLLCRHLGQAAAEITPSDILASRMAADCRGYPGYSPGAKRNSERAYCAPNCVNGASAFVSEQKVRAERHRFCNGLGATRTTFEVIRVRRRGYVDDYPVRPIVWSRSGSCPAPPKH